MSKRFVLSTGVFLFLLIRVSCALAQTNTDKAKELGRQATALEDGGNFNEALKLFAAAQKLDPASLSYPYETAYLCYNTKKYPEAITILNGLISRSDATAKVYQLLGDCYDLIGDTPKAMATYNAGIGLFPAAGGLYLEAAVIQIDEKDYRKALAYCEQGIKADPAYPSNYYWAARLYCNSSERVNGIIYGELFMNLERNSERTAEIGKLLFDTYKAGITFGPDGKANVSFTDNAAVNVPAGTVLAKIKRPFTFAYESVLAMSLSDVRAVDLNSLNRMRIEFLANYQKLKMDSKYPNALFDYQNEIAKAGYFEAYNYYILMHGDDDAFTAWRRDNKDKWNSFINWYNSRPIKLNNGNRFYSGQYN